MPGGTASREYFTESRSNPQVPATMTALITEADRWIHTKPASEENDGAGDGHAGGKRGIGSHVHERRADVQILPAPLMNRSAVTPVHHDPRDRHDDDGASAGGFGCDQAFDGRPTDTAGDHEQDDGVGEGGEDGGAAKAIGVLAGRGTHSSHAASQAALSAITSPRLWPASARSATE